MSNGKAIPNKKLTFDPPKPLTYSYCSDTAYFEDIIPIIENSDLLYHESTFLEDKADLAEKTKHTTALQAARIAKQANVKKLILGHYSSRYNNLNLFLEEAQTVFLNVELCEAGKVFLTDNK